MLKAIIFAGIGTLLCHFVFRYVKSIQQVLAFKRVRESILVSTMHYVKQTPDHFIDLNQLHQLALRKLKESDLKKWVKALKITWASQDAIQFFFEFEFTEIHTRYKFVVGIKEIQRAVDDMTLS